MPHLTISQFLSPTQLAGYAAFVLGITAFLQRDDRRLKLFLILECAVYVVHFVLLGNLPAASSAGVSAVRNLLSLRYRSWRLAIVAMATSLALGFLLVRSPVGWLPVVGSCLGTWGLFMMKGIPMRLLVLVSTILWLVNNIISGSIGGVLLETFIALASISTMLRIAIGSRRTSRRLEEPGS
ncbi:MAG: YgjV family protein [Polyangiaceae bacterium]